VEDRPVGLTLTKFLDVHTLAKFPGHVKDREGLMASEPGRDEGTITSHVKRIRRKFSPRSIPAFRADRYGVRHGLPVKA